MNRRHFITTAAATAAAASAQSPISADVVRRHDEAVDRYLAAQVTDTSSRWRGAMVDGTGLYAQGTAGGILGAFGTAYIYRASKHHGKAEVLERVRLAADFLNRTMSADGNITLPITNFNSPPDTAFMVTGLASLMRLARNEGARDVAAILEPLLARCGQGLVKGGIHTPNHRWVVCSALAQLNEVMPNPAYVRRVDQWLAEEIDIDSDGQYTERSTGGYNPIVDRALIVVADKLKRPALLEHVRRNLDSLLYLLHPDFEVVTEISRRQDQYQRAGILGYWFPLTYMAVRDGNGQYATLAAHAAPQAASLGVLLEYPELTKAVTPAAVPENYEKHFPALGISRIRRGRTSATVIRGGSSRFFTFRRGDAVVTAVRFASAFFGKGQFVPEETTGYALTQDLSAGYYQPLDSPVRVTPDNWFELRKTRKVTELCKLRQSATIREVTNGFDVRIQASGTDEVPLVIEIAFAPGGTLTGCDAVKDVEQAYLMSAKTASYRAGKDEIRFGPMLRQHSYVMVRGAEPRIPAQQCVYLTALTPVDHTIEFRFG